MLDMYDARCRHLHLLSFHKSLLIENLLELFVPESLILYAITILFPEGEFIIDVKRRSNGIKECQRKWEERE